MSAFNHDFPTTPLPMDRNAVREAVEAALTAHPCRLPVEDAVQALCGCDMRIASATPMKAAMLLATVWMHQTEWRPTDPRARVVLVTHAGKAAARLREAGFNAVTAFAYGREGDAFGHGLVLAVDAIDVSREDLMRLVDTPPWVKLVMIDDPDRLDSVVPPVA